MARRLLTFAALLAALEGAPGCKPSGRLAYDKSEVLWGGGASEQDAAALGAFLQEVQYFGPGRQVTVKLDREKELSESPPTYRVTFVVADGAWNDDAVVGHAQNMGDDMKRRLFGQAQTLVLIADAKGVEKRKLYAR